MKNTVMLCLRESTKQAELRISWDTEISNYVRSNNIGLPSEKESSCDDMATGSLIDVVQKAVDQIGMTDVLIEDRTVLLSDNGPGYLSRQFREYLRFVGIRHIIASPYYPQTNGKIERYHRTIKGEINLVPYEMPDELKEAIKAFIEYYNYHRYHEGLDDVTPYDVYTDRHLGVIQRRKEVKSKTLEARSDHNRTAREQGAWPLKCLLFSKTRLSYFH